MTARSCRQSEAAAERARNNNGSADALGRGGSAIKPTKHSERFDWLDVLRALAIGDIVALHTTNPYPHAGIGLPVFVLCTIALAAKRSPPYPWKENLARRTSRLLWPWLFWSAFYGVVNTFRAWRSGKERFGDLLSPELSMLWSGTEIVLWYLPFAFLAEVLVNAVMRVAEPLHTRHVKQSIVFWLVSGAALLTAVALILGDQAMPPRMTNYAKSGYLIPLGIGVGLLLRNYSKHLATCATLIVLGSLMVAAHAAATQAGQINAGDVLPNWQWQAGIAMVLVGGALAIRGHAPRWLVGLSALTFPVYLLHIFIAWPVTRVIDRTVGEVPDSLFWLIVWGLSLIAAVACKKTPVIKRLC